MEPIPEHLNTSDILSCNRNGNAYCYGNTSLFPCIHDPILMAFMVLVNIPTQQLMRYVASDLLLDTGIARKLDMGKLPF